MSPSRARSLVVLACTAVALFIVATITTSCASVLASAGISTLDSAEAVAIAQRNLCGGASDTTCAVRAYRRVGGGRYIVTLDRRPPAGNDRVVVTLLHNGSDIQAAEADSVARKP